MKSGALVIVVVLAFGCANEQRIADLERRVKATEDEQARQRKAFEEMAAAAKTAFAAVKEIQSDTKAMQSGVKAMQGDLSAIAGHGQATHPASRQELELVSIDMSSGESNSSWTKFSYLMTVRNNTDEEKRFGGDVQFTDAKGFVVSEVPTGVQSVRARSVETVTGYDLINAMVAARVSNVRAQIKWK